MSGFRPYDPANGDSIYPPSQTGTNSSGTGIVVYSSNTTDSVASADIDTFVSAKHSSNGFFPNPIYDVGVISLDNSEMKFTNISPNNYSMSLSFSGSLISDSTSNTAILSARLNSTGGVGTGTQQRYSAGPTGGSTNVRSGFLVIGAFTLAPSESVWLEVSKSVAGTLIAENSLAIIKPIY